MSNPMSSNLMRRLPREVKAEYCHFYRKSNIGLQGVFNMPLLVKQRSRLRLGRKQSRR